MKVLVACEESQRVCLALRNVGLEAYSCDIVDCTGGHPEWHIKRCAVEQAYRGIWDMIIAFPPCTYLSNAGANHMRKDGKIQLGRWSDMMTARSFFLKLLNSPCGRVCIENPTPMSIAGLPSPTQVIQPWMFGDPYTKRTCLWLKGLPPLSPTQVVNPIGSWVGMNRNQTIRSKTFHGIASAMAAQWGKLR